VDRGYTEQGFDGSVVRISGTLPLMDSDPAMPGVITGGFSDRYGGAYVASTYSGHGGKTNVPGGAAVTGNTGNGADSEVTAHAVFFAESAPASAFFAAHLDFRFS